MKAEAMRIASDPKAVASRCPEPKEEEGSEALAMARTAAASLGEDKDMFLCMEVPSLPRVRPNDGPPEINIYHPESGIKKVALVAAQRLIAEAKRSGVYPKRKPGDLY